MQNLTQSPLKHLIIEGDTSPINLIDDFELSSQSSQNNTFIQSGRKNSDGDNTVRRKKFRSQDFTEQLYMWNGYLVKKFESKQL
ncbi:unnamed protein product [Paramecium primaurelia]|uniref:Uncharacterized protein n=2 Tax=Paramecium TaxID=5884 RepID=A0A8S1YKX7_9CILI|nr:unnamed protein product [Paramecium primaurelia]CAD8212212.1 unnamed protein product [Paramecium pentaurelia]